MKHSAAMELITKLQIMAQKSRSNMTEALAGYGELSKAEESVLVMTHPYLFADLKPGGEDANMSILRVIDVIIAKGFIEPMELYNLLILVDKSPAMMMASVVFGVTIPRVSPIPKWIARWEEE